MSATDELRRLLDERGVEWLEDSPNKTKWHVGGIEFVATNAWPRNDATRTKMVVHAMYPTPEQAVEATLGSDLQAENAKLRELVQDMYACIEALCSMVENSPGCSMCPTNQDEEKPCAAADVYCRMRELGVEV